MPDRRRSRRELTPAPHDPRREAGARLKRAIHVARAGKGLTSDVQLSVQSGIAYDTLYNWYSGRTVPRGAELRKMAMYLGVPFAQLQAVYDGVEPEPMPLQESVRELVDSLNDLVAELRMTRAEQVVVVEQMAEALGHMATTPRSPSPEARRWAQQRAEEATRPRRPKVVPEPEPDR